MILHILLVFFCISAFSLFSSPLENGAAPQIIQQGFFIPHSWWISIRGGYEGDFVADENLEQTEESSGYIDTFQQTTNSATITLNILDRLDLFGLVGSSRVCANWRFEEFEAVTRIQMETFYRFFWGVGFREILLEWGRLTLDIGGRYSNCRYKPSWLASNGVPQETSGASLEWRSWQAGLVLSYQIDLFVPYIGAQYSNVRARLGVFPVPIADNGSGTNHFENRIPVGMVIGCALSNGRYFMINIEGRLINEEAFTISGDLRF